MKVRVRVPVTFEVDYIIDVKDSKNVEEITEQMMDMDASSWESDPEFYEKLGDNFRDYVLNVTEEHIEEIEAKVVGVITREMNGIIEHKHINYDYFHPQLRIHTPINFQSEKRFQYFGRCGEIKEEAPSYYQGI